ncbi:hypothetical protein FHS72_000079 [Loktanella ponticola]|uniref:Uncharacterized protein n=1 Tax=Yoonia ponticola TaxID=1524255 RepID=A0A7W9EXV6_9RHOB|nr:hypothetical protein [Yoonia ponticola]MBB5720475.1 hypothetical protein [Yoonia ponticola]
MRTLPYLFLVAAAGLSLATFMTSQTLASQPAHVAVERVLGVDWP